MSNVEIKLDFNFKVKIVKAIIIVSTRAFLAKFMLAGLHGSEEGKEKSMSTSPLILPLLLTDSITPLIKITAPLTYLFD